MEYFFFLSVLVLGRKICNGKLEMECESVGEWASEWVWFNYDGATARRQHKRQGERVFRAVVWKWMPVILSLRGIAFLAFAVLLIAAFLSFLGSTCLPFLYNLGIPHQFNFRFFFLRKKRLLNYDMHKWPLFAWQRPGLRMCHAIDSQILDIGIYTHTCACVYNHNMNR